MVGQILQPCITFSSLNKSDFVVNLTQIRPRASSVKALVEAIFNKEESLQQTKNLHLKFYSPSGLETECNLQRNTGNGCQEEECLEELLTPELG